MKVSMCTAISDDILINNKHSLRQTQAERVIDDISSGETNRKKSDKRNTSKHVEKVRYMDDNDFV